MRAVLFFVGFAACLSARAEMADRGGWFNVSFDGYGFGEVLSERGAKGGAWERNSSYLNGSANVDVCNGLKCLRCATTIEDGLSFVANDPSGDDLDESYVSFTVSYPEIVVGPGETWSPPAIDADSRAAFFVGIDTENGNAPVFFGWTADGWVKLRSSKIAAAFDTWYGGRMRFTAVEGRLCVEYQLARRDGSYVTLADDASATQFPCGHAAGGLSWSKVLFRGFGFVDYLGSYRRKGQVRLHVE